jgi:hypothetical protein
MRFKPWALFSVFALALTVLAGCGTYNDNNRTGMTPNNARYAPNTTNNNGNMMPNGTRTGNVAPNRFNDTDQNGIPDTVQYPNATYPNRIAPGPMTRNPMNNNTTNDGAIINR